MRKEDFFEVLGELDNDIVQEAAAPMKRKIKGKAWVTAAACFAVVVMTISILPHTSPAGVNSQESADVAIEMRNLRIYYLSETGTIESKTMEMRCVPEDIFREWAALNHISDVAFVSCVYENGGSEKHHGNVVEYTLGDFFTLELTVSPEFSSYADGEHGDLLIQSLRQTFCDYLSTDSFRLIYE